jgi:hypothetical protein
MSATRKIQVTIGQSGDVSVEAIGYKGGKCKEATKPLTDALLGPDVKSENKPEFYQADTTIQLKENE